MSTAYRSRDTHWRVSVIQLDGVQRIRIEHDTFQLPDGSYIPVHYVDGGTRAANVIRTAFGFHVADVRTAQEAAEHVDMSTLVPEVRKS
jgi:hypothetical protein